MTTVSITLKMNGKAYTCEGKTTGKRCKSKEFINFGRTDLIGRDYDEDQFKCIACNLVVERNGRTLETQLPPRNDWRTPGGSVFAPVKDGLWTTLHEEYVFNLDAAADEANRKCLNYLDGSEGHDALVLNWFDDFSLTAEETRVWWNCPYNPKGSVETWLIKALEQAQEGVFSVGLIPMSTSVAWFNELVIPYAEWHSFFGRIAFEDPLATEDDERTSPKQDNLLVIFDPNSNTIGHTTVRDAKTGKRLWTRPDLIEVACG